jgi:NitT/TauT family transport system ATP-binding protein
MRTDVAPDRVTGDVELQGVGKTFASGSENEFTAVSSIDLQIGGGEFVSLIGPSGCGKSTLLRLIADIIQPTTGSIRVLGKSARDARLARGYGMVFQQPTLLDWRTVRKNVELPLQVIGLDREERQHRASELLQLVELSEFENRYPWQLSGGMQQRIAIARALAFDPPILLMDEPFGALDEMTRERMQTEVLRIWERLRPTVIFVTHSIPEAAFLSQRVVVMASSPGQIFQEIPIDMPYPRGPETREHPEFYRVLTSIREALRLGGAVAATSDPLLN